MKINLKDLMYGPESELPIELSRCNVIYLITNLINGHKYIGQAKYFFSRFRSNTYLSHKTAYEDLTKNRIYLYNALRKYGLENFEVELLEVDVIDLDEREIYWIAYYHTYFRDPEYKGGYNMTKGGPDHKAFTENAHKRLKELYPNTNGAPTNFVNHDRTNSLLAARKACLSYWPELNGANPNLIASSKNRPKSSYEKGILTKKLRYSNNSDFYNGVISKDASSAGVETHSQNSIIRAINSRLQYLKDNNYEITAYNYYNYAYSGSSMWNQHIPRILKRLSDLKNHPNWTEEMTNIFSHIIPNPDKTSKGKNKFIILN